MTDTNPTLTEDGSSCNLTNEQLLDSIIEVLEDNESGIHNYMKKCDWSDAWSWLHENKQQILTALEQYPKLKEKSLQYDKFLEYAEKTQRIHEDRRGSESAPFTPREGIISLIPMDFKEFVDYKKIKAENEELTKDNKLLHISNSHLQKENDAFLNMYKNLIRLHESTRQERESLKQLKQRILEWKARLQSKAHLIEYTHDMLIDKIDNELLKDDTN